MKTLFGFILIIVGLVSLSNYPNLGRDLAETSGAIFGISIVTFLPAYFLIKNDNKSKTNEK
jgi:hypothetical protein